MGTESVVDRYSLSSIVLDCEHPCLPGVLGLKNAFGGATRLTRPLGADGA